MEIHEIQVHIKPDGQVEIAVQGVNGSGCLNITAELEAALGGNVVLREMKAEASEPPALDNSLIDPLRSGG
uniref:DUF2997 domain-containing protein n=1 Tax=Anaerolinea thermolimosa TaxID=229919 RepID=A0A7C4KGQ6_9CHLR